ncbi:hypothetical protein B0H10DRAFT_2230519 [Mycena sp. CBHHK59/15]|nr:hypothetical protein B0H10DRAFT_2230519 [Mycena sp. CBHHK59/15]
MTPTGRARVKTSVPRAPKPAEFDAEFADATASCALRKKSVARKNHKNNKWKRCTRRRRCQRRAHPCEDEDYVSHVPPSPPNSTPSSLTPRRAARSVKRDAAQRRTHLLRWVHKPKALPVDLQLALVPQRDRLLASPSATPSPLIRARIRIHRTPVHETRTSEAAGSLLRS